MTILTCNKMEVSMGSKHYIVICRIDDNRTDIVYCICVVVVVVVFTWRESGVIKTELKAQHVSRRTS